MGDAESIEARKKFAVHIAEAVNLLRQQAASALRMAGWYPEGSSARVCLEAQATTCTAEAVALEALPPPAVLA